MNVNIDPAASDALTELLRCPKCGQRVEIASAVVSWTGCSTTYPVREGVVGLVHEGRFVTEELDFFHEMDKPKCGSVSAQEWVASKNEYLAALRDELRDVHGASILHVGCGTDIFVDEFDDARCYVSCDIVEDALLAIKPRSSRGKAMVRASVDNLPFRDERFETRILPTVTYPNASRRAVRLYRSLCQLMPPAAALVKFHWLLLVRRVE